MKDALDKIYQILKEATNRELAGQGHRLTGALEESIASQIDEIPDGWQLIVTMAHYAGYMERGVSSDNIPFSPGSGKGRSLYIDGLIKFAELRGMTNPKSAAFAIAHAHKDQGMPTFKGGKSGRGSYAFSKNDRRTGFAAQVLEDNEDKIREVINAEVVGYFYTEINNAARRHGAQVQTAQAPV